MNRQPVSFDSGGTRCAAWFYPGGNGACVIMTGGFGVPKEPGTDRFAERFQAEGFTVLAFDHRHLGESGGEPRYVLRRRDQLADWRAALAFAATLPGVDPDRMALWAFSAAAGHLFTLAVGGARVAAIVAQSPNLDGPAATRNAGRYQRPVAQLRLTGRVVRDLVGGLLGRPPLLVPSAGPPGTVAMLTTPDAQDTARGLRTAQYPEWEPVVAARSIPPLMFVRPGRLAPRIGCPLLVLAGDDDRTALTAPAVRAAEEAPHGELVLVPGGHYAPFLDQHEAAVRAEVDFLRRHLVRATSRSTSGTP